MIVFPTEDLADINQLAINATCVFCGEKDSIHVSRKNYLSWLAGEFAQIAFQEFTPSEREFFFISGVCDSCFHSI